jgi:CubicO group peptidase (beta-lactamase class C family)
VRVLPSLVFSLGVALCAQKAPPGTVVQPELGARFDAIVREAPGHWGCVLVAVKGQVVLAKGYGSADRAQVPLQPASLFDLGGTSAQLTALLAWKFFGDRKLRLEDPVARHLEDWPADKAAITIAHLLARTSGLPPDAAWAGGAANATRTAAQAIGRTRLVDRPGAAFHDSALNSVLLAIVLEQVGKARFDKLLVDRLLKPAGMRTAGPCNGTFDDRLVTQRRVGPGGLGEPATAFDHNWAHRGARSVLASVLDVHELLLAGTGGKLVAADAWAAVHEPLPGGDAFSVAVLANEGLVRVAGRTTGYACCWLLHRESRSWIVLATDDTAATPALERDLALELLQRLQPATAGAGRPAPSPGAAPPPADAGAAPDRSGGAGAAGGARPTEAGGDLDRFVGTFALPAGGGTFCIERTGSGLRLQASGLQASARIAGAWSPLAEPRLRSLEDRGLAILGWLCSDDVEMCRGAFATADAADAAGGLVRQWLASKGPHLRSELVGTRLGERDAESWFRLVGARGDLVLAAVWSDARQLARCGVGEAPAQFAADVVLVRPDAAAARTAAGFDLLLTVEGRGSSRCLVYEDPAGLLDCVLVPSGR